PEREKTSRYSEFGSTGPGAKPDERASWTRSLSANDAAAITVAGVLGWDPRRVPTNPSAAQVNASPLPQAPGVPAETTAQVIPLWPEGAPSAKPGAAPEQVADGRVSNVQTPTLTYFPAPPAITVGTAIIICPGGGYDHLAFDKEGTDVAKRLNAIGVSA